MWLQLDIDLREPKARANLLSSPPFFSPPLFFPALTSLLSPPLSSPLLSSPPLFSPRCPCSLFHCTPPPPPLLLILVDVLYRTDPLSRSHMVPATFPLSASSAWLRPVYSHLAWILALLSAPGI
eukprot:530832-Hanusia_phi.AAC.1